MRWPPARCPRPRDEPGPGRDLLPEVVVEDGEVAAIGPVVHLAGDGVEHSGRVANIERAGQTAGFRLPERVVQVERDGQHRGELAGCGYVRKRGRRNVAVNDQLHPLMSHCVGGHWRGLPVRGRRGRRRQDRGGIRHSHSGADGRGPGGDNGQRDDQRSDVGLAGSEANRFVHVR
jgi:hypothetical protein